MANTLTSGIFDGFITKGSLVYESTSARPQRSSYGRRFGDFLL